MRPFLLVLVAFLLACSGLADPVAAVPEPAPVAAPEAPPAPGPPSATDLLAAFEKDCGHVVLAPFEGIEGPGTAPECVAQDFEQNCAPDQLGCWAGYEGCLDGCNTRCTGCADSCTRGCEDCKAACAGKADGGACVRACAASRVLCRDTCMANRLGCRDTACPADMNRCESDGAARRERECPDCAALAACVMENYTDASVCDRRFASMGEWCLRACAPDP